MDILAAKERQVLRLRFGAAERPRTHVEVAAMLNLPEDIVRRIESHALRKLRRNACDPLGSGFDGWDEV